MSFASNNSRNIANLLRYQPLEPINPVKRPLPALPTNTSPQLPPSRQRNEVRQQIPVEEVFTPEEQQRQIRRKTPHYETRGSRQDDSPQVEALRVRLEQIVRYYEQRHNNLESKMAIRLSELESFVMKEVPKIDNTTMLSSDLIALKQNLKDLRKMQEYQNNQITALKSLSSDRNSGDALQLLNKEKQKSTVLFMEVVRLGDTVQKMNEYVNTMTKSYESKYNELQNKMSNADKNMMIVSQRTSSGSDIMNELGDKIMARLNTSESNLLMLGKQQVKDQEAIAKLNAQNDRIGEDLQLLLRNMQADFQSKLETRVNQTVNRLMQEHEERLRSQQQIKKNLDLRERLMNEKQLNEKMQNKAKYDTMDSVIKNQLMKKEQSIRSLHMAMEDQFRNMMKQLQAEGGRRKQQEANMRSQIRRVQENLRKQYDLYKNHQSELVEKITQMIKSEIQVRMSTQFDLKKLTTNVAHEIVNDLNGIKEALSTSNKKLTHAIREVSSQSADRAGQLSHYVDSQVKKVVEVVTQKYSKMKSVFTKLAEQLKNHLQNTEQNRKNVEGRLTAIEEDFDKLKNEVNGQIDEFYNDLEIRLKEEKQFVETVVFKKNNDLTVRVSKLQQYTNQYFELLKAGIEDNKDILNKKIAGLGGSEASQNQEEMKRLQGIVFQIKKITQQIKTQNEQEFQEIRKDIRDAEGRQAGSLVESQNKLDLKIAKNVQKQKQLEDQMNEISVKINKLQTEINEANSSNSNDKIKRVQDSLEAVEDRLNSNQQQTTKLGEDLTVLKSELQALQEKVK